MVLLFLSLFARADYFDIDRQIRGQEAAREAATAESLAQRAVAQHNAQLSGFVAQFGGGHRGAYNLVGKRCTEVCFDDRGLRRREDWIDQMTFDTGDGYACYAEVFPAGHAVHCVNPQTQQRLDDDRIERQVRADIEKMSRAYKRRRH